jgi:hypothetical protein
MKYFFSLLALTIVILVVWVVYDRQVKSVGDELIFVETYPVTDSSVTNRPSAEVVTNWFDDVLTSSKNTNQLIRPVLQGQPIAIETFAEAQNITIDDNLAPLLAPNEWMLYRCPSPTLEPALAMLLHFQLLPEYEGNLYEDQVRFMRFWEATLLEDMRNVIYPPQYYSQAPSLVGDYTDIEISNFFSAREATTQLTSNRTGEIIYLILDDDLIIANSKSCLEQMQSEIFDLSA